MSNYITSENIKVIVDSSCLEICNPRFNLKKSVKIQFLQKINPRRIIASETASFIIILAIEGCYLISVPPHIDQSEDPELFEEEVLPLIPKTRNKAEILQSNDIIDIKFTDDERFFIALTKMNTLLFFSTLPLRYYQEYHFNLAYVPSYFWIDNTLRLFEIYYSMNQSNFDKPECILYLKFPDVVSTNCSTLQVIKDVKPEANEISYLEPREPIGLTPLSYEELHQMVHEKDNELYQRQTDVIERRNQLKQLSFELVKRKNELKKREEACKAKNVELYRRILDLISLLDRPVDDQNTDISVLSQRSENAQQEYSATIQQNDYLEDYPLPQKVIEKVLETNIYTRVEKLKKTKQIEPPVPV